jgi:hypothetical protein
MNHDELQSLQAFSFTCNELKKTAFGSQFTVASCKAYRLQQNTLHSTKIRSQDNDQFRSFMLSFRKLVINKEIGSFNRVLNILSKHGNKHDQDRIREIKKGIKAVEQSVAGVQVGVGRDYNPIIPSEAFDAMINGVLFHNDQKRQSDLEFFREAGASAFLSVCHYVVFVYKQALRIQGAINLRGVA